MSLLIKPVHLTKGCVGSSLLPYVTVFILTGGWCEIKAGSDNKKKKVKVRPMQKITRLKCFIAAIVTENNYVPTHLFM